MQPVPLAPIFAAAIIGRRAYPGRDAFTGELPLNSAHGLFTARISIKAKCDFKHADGNGFNVDVGPSHGDDIHQAGSNEGDRVKWAFGDRDMLACCQSLSVKETALISLLPAPRL